MAQQKLKDPVQSSASMDATTDAISQLETFSPVSVMPHHTRVSNPFDGYPLQYVGKGKDKVCITHLVLYNHIAFPVRQNPRLRPVKTKSGEIKTPITAHSRAIRDYDEKQNTEVVFDRGPLKTAKGEFYYAIVPNAYVRAQVVFHYNAKTGAIENDKRYLLMDGSQIDRLFRCFQMVINPKLKIEKQASFISGESTADPGDMAEPTEDDLK